MSVIITIIIYITLEFFQTNLPNTSVRKPTGAYMTTTRPEQQLQAIYHYIKRYKRQK